MVKKVCIIFEVLQYDSMPTLPA